MDRALLSHSFSAEDAGFALGHHNFSEWRRNWTRAGHQLLPRRAPDGRAGGEYKWPHIFEMALFMKIYPVIGTEKAKSVIFCLFHNLSSRGIDYINKLFQEERGIISACGLNGDFTSLDSGLESFGGFIAYPAIFFGEEFLKSNPDLPTWMVFAPGAIPPQGATGSDLLLTNDAMPLNEIQRQYRDRRRQEYMMDQATWSIDDWQSSLLVTINLSEIVDAINQRLQQRLRAKNIGLRLPPS